MRKTSLVLLAALLPLAAQDPVYREARPFLRVTGEGLVQAKPDQAEMNLGVLTQGATAEEAGAQNARQTSVVLESVRAVLGANADIKTINYSLAPNQRYSPNGGNPSIVGYTASNTLHVRLPDLSLVGKLIDAATKVGSNTIQGVQFTVRDPQAVRTQALRQAAQQAKATAEALASALGLRIVRVLSAENTSVSVRPFEVTGTAMAKTASFAATPVEPGSVDVRASVVLTFEVAP